MSLYETQLSSETLYVGRVFTACKDMVRLPNDKEVSRERVIHGGGVCVVALDEHGRIPMVRQFRYGVGKVLLEVPAGKLEAGEDPQACGIRELREECGLLAERVESLGHIIPTGAYCSEIIYIYLARQLTVTETQLDADEFLEVEWLPFNEALTMAADGRISDAKTVAALFRAQHSLNAST